MPQAKDCVVIGSNVWRRGQTTGIKAKIRLIHGHKIQAAIRVDVYATEGLLVQRKRERQSDARVAIVTVISSVDCPWHHSVRASRDDILGRAYWGRGWGR